MSDEWKKRHSSAWQSPIGIETPIVGLIKAWSQYNTYHAAEYGSPVGDDGFLGPAWIEIGRGIRTLLNGSLGRLDAGTLDSFIYDSMVDQEGQL